MAELDAPPGYNASGVKLGDIVDAPPGVSSPIAPPATTELDAPPGFTSSGTKIGDIVDTPPGIGQPAAPRVQVTPHDLDGIIFNAAKKYGIDARILKAVGIQETNLGKSYVYDQQRGVSKTPGNKGHGVWQLDPASGAKPEDLLKVSADPAYAADYAARMLKNLMDQYHGDLPSALAAYNAGTPQSTAGQQYAQSVIGHLQTLDPMTHDPVIVQRIKHAVGTFVHAEQHGRDGLKALGREPQIRPIAQVQKNQMKGWEWAKGHKVEAVLDILGAPQRAIGATLDELNKGFPSQPTNKEIHWSDAWKNIQALGTESKHIADNVWDAVMHPTDATQQRTTASVGQFVNNVAHRNVVPSHKQIDDAVRSHIWKPIQAPIATTGKVAEDFILQSLSDPTSLVRIPVMAGARAVGGTLRAVDALMQRTGVAQHFGLNHVAQVYDNLSKRAFRVRNDLHNAGFTDKGVKARIAMENAHLAHATEREKGIRNVEADPQQSVNFFQNLLQQHGPSGHIGSVNAPLTTSELLDPTATPEIRRAILTKLSDNIQKNGLKADSGQMFGNAPHLFTGSQASLDKLGTKEMSKMEDFNQNSPFSGLRDLGKKAIMWNPIPHGLKNVGTLVYQAGGLPAVVHGISAMINPPDIKTVQRLRDMGGLPNYLNDHSTGLLKNSQAMLERMEVGWRTGLMHTLDKELGVPATREEELVRGWLINHKVGDYRNQSSFVKMFQALGGPFVAFRLGIVPGHILDTLKNNPGRITGQLRLRQDMQQNRDKPGVKKNEIEVGGPVDDGALLAVDPQKFLARTTGLEPLFDTGDNPTQAGIAHRVAKFGEGLAKAYIPGLAPLLDSRDILMGTERPGEKPTLTQQLEDAFTTALGVYYKRKPTPKQEHQKYRRIQRS